MAADRGYEELVKDLLDGGADLNACDGWTPTPLNTAAARGFERIVCTLLARGAGRDGIEKKDFDSPLMKAVRAGHLGVVTMLLAAGADVEIRGRPGRTAIVYAARGGHTEIVNALLEHGADVNASGEQGYSALHEAAVGDHVGVTDALVDAGADMELKCPYYGITPLGGASALSRREAMCTLLRRGADTETRTPDGNSPLHLACGNQNDGLDEAVHLLLNFGADETAVNNDGKTAAQMTESMPRRGRSCSQETVDRACLLLARAPNNRAWRRRCWVVMLRSGASRARTAGGNDADVSGHDFSPADGRREDSGSETARVERAGGCGSGVVGPGGNARAIGFGGEGGCLSSLVASLIGLELDGVFRTVVGFL